MQLIQQAAAEIIARRSDCRSNNAGTAAKPISLGMQSNSTNTKDPSTSQKESLERKEKYPQKRAYLEHELIAPFSKHRHTYPV